jgi:ADP-ribose pyrophosphatase
VRFSNLLRPEPGWETRSATTHYEDKHLAVVTEVVKTPMRAEPKPWTVVHRKAAVVVAPMTADGKFILVRQERVPIQATIWEMPAGQIDDKMEPDESEIRTVALRELNEEAGYELAPGGELISLGHFFGSPGFTDERCYFFLALPVQRASIHHREEGEGIVDCRGFSAAELSAMIAANEIRDANTLSICARMAARGFFEFKPAAAGGSDSAASSPQDESVRLADKGLLDPP